MKIEWSQQEERPNSIQNIVAAFQGMHVLLAKHSYVWLPRKCEYRTDRRTDRCRTNRIYHHFVQGHGNPPECQRFVVHDEACPVVEVAYRWHKGGFPCPCSKWWLINFLLSPLMAVKNPLFYFRNTSERIPIIKPRQLEHRVIVKVMTSLYDHHFHVVHNGVVGDNLLETSFWILIKRMDIHVWGRRKRDPYVPLCFAGDTTYVPLCFAGDTTIN